MGVYLSTPKTDKFSEDGENHMLRFGLSAMQGWRATVEDVTSLDIERGLSHQKLEAFKFLQIKCVIEPFPDKHGVIASVYTNLFHRVFAVHSRMQFRLGFRMRKDGLFHEKLMLEQLNRENGVVGEQYKRRAARRSSCR